MIIRVVRDTIWVIHGITVRVTVIVEVAIRLLY